MAQLLSTWIDGFLGSAKASTAKAYNTGGKIIPQFAETFTTGMMGAGWKIYKDAYDTWTLEIDKLRIRQSLTAQELIVEQTKAICGALGITQACGKVKAVTLHEYIPEGSTSGQKYYRMEMEGDDVHGYGGFKKGDFIRCQKINTTDPDATFEMGGYWVQLSDVQENGKYIMAWLSEFEDVDFCKEFKQDDITQRGEYVFDGGQGEFDTPTAGDNIVQFGSATDATRRSAIYLHATNGYPAVDVMDGINSRSFRGCIKARLGYGIDGNNSLGLFTSAGRILSRNADGTTLYELSPDGTVNLGKGAITYSPTTGQTVLSNTTVKMTDSEGETAVEMNPDTGTYTFRGTVVATAGEFNGLSAGFTASSVCTVTKDTFWKFFEMFKPNDSTAKSKEYIRPCRATLGKIYVLISAPESALCQTSQGTKYVNIYLPPYAKGGQTPWQGLSMMGQSFTFIICSDTSSSTEKKHIPEVWLRSTDMRFAIDPNGEFDNTNEPQKIAGTLNGHIIDCGYVAEYECRSLKAAYDDKGNKLLQTVWQCRRCVYDDYDLWDYTDDTSKSGFPIASTPQQFVTW